MWAGVSEMMSWWVMWCRKQERWREDEEVLYSTALALVAADEASRSRRLYLREGSITNFNTYEQRQSHSTACKALLKGRWIASHDYMKRHCHWSVDNTFATLACGLMKNFGVAGIFANLAEISNGLHVGLAALRNIQLSSNSLQINSAYDYKSWSSVTRGQKIILAYPYLCIT